MKGLSNDEKRALDANIRSELRYRLTENEAELIDALRDTGVLPEKYLVHADRNIAKLSARYQTLRKKYVTSLKELDRLEDRLDALLALRKKTGQQILNIKPTKADGKSETVVMLIAADWHIGQTVDPATVNDLNAYNTEIAIKCIASFFERGLYLVDLWRGKTRIDTLIIPFLGDLMSGDIHPELRESNELTPIEASIALKDAICQGLDFIATEGKLKRIICPWKFGNHSRATPDVRHGTAWKTSYEYLLGRDLAWRYEGHPVIQFQVDEGYHSYLKLPGDFMVRLHHGDAFNYRDGIGGISIPVNKKIYKWNKALPVDLDVFGHFHQYKDGGHWICVPSLVGYDPYALKIGAEYEAPRQWFLAFKKGTGLSAMLPVLIEPTGKERLKIYGSAS